MCTERTAPPIRSFCGSAAAANGILPYLYAQSPDEARLWFQMFHGRFCAQKLNRFRLEYLNAVIAAAVLQHFGKRAIVVQRCIQSARPADIAFSKVKFLRQILFAARHIHKLSVLSAVDMYQPLFLLLIQMKRRILHSKRLEDVRFIILRSIHTG